MPAAEPIRIAFIDGVSGSFANVGEGSWRHLVLAMEAINRRGGVLGGRRLVAAEFDSKSNPQEALLALRAAMDQGYRIVFQGNGSNVALALSDAIAKHAQRNPQDPVLFLDYAAADPALTNERCSFWHFRFEADVPMKMRALVDAIANTPDVRSVYLINQDYSFGQSVSRYAREMLRQKRPDIRIAGDDLHPLGQVKDFAPYAAKIKASTADAVITGNWGNDLNLLVKAAREMDLDATFYTYFGASDGAATVIGKAGVGRMKVVNVWHPNIGGSRTDELVSEWRTRFPDSPTDPEYASFRIALQMLASALDHVGSLDLRKWRSRWRECTSKATPARSGCVQTIISSFSRCSCPRLWWPTAGKSSTTSSTPASSCAPIVGSRLGDRVTHDLQDGTALNNVLRQTLLVNCQCTDQMLDALAVEASLGRCHADGEQRRKGMNRVLAFVLRAVTMVVLAIGFASIGASEGWAQQKTKLSYQRPPDMSDYTKQYRIDVGDVPGHQIRIYELKGTYPKGFLTIAGVGVGDEYTRGYSDYVDNNGRHWGYCEYEMENGDKIFCRVEGSSQRTTQSGRQQAEHLLWDHDLRRRYRQVPGDSRPPPVYRRLRRTSQPERGARRRGVLVRAVVVLRRAADHSASPGVSSRDSFLPVRRLAAADPAGASSPSPVR